MNDSYSRPDSYIRLSDDPIFNQKTINFEPVIEIIKQTKPFDDIIQNEEYDMGLFVMTEGAQKRLNKINEAFECNFPVLLEGPTGTSKTKSVQILSSIKNKELIRFNLSSETTTEDLLGRLISDKDSWGCFSFSEGPFIQAFAYGKWLLLDEINLAPQSILQCMESALDSHEKSIEIPGRSLVVYKQHKDFRIVATQNPNDGRFAMKRESLTTKFLSRFTPVEFPEISSEELLEIALKQAYFFHYKNTEFVKSLISFHYKWSHLKETVNSAHCFTIREISASIQSIQSNDNPFDAIMTFYGMRYDKKTRNSMIDMVRTDFPNLYSPPCQYEIPTDFPSCYKNNSLKLTLKYINLAFESQRHVLLIGKEGSGLTQVARWVAEYYSQKINKSHMQNDVNSPNTQIIKNKDFCFICTPETTISDWIGRVIPVPKTDDGSDIIVWKNGPILKAIIKGKCGVLDNIELAPAKVCERLNGLLDPKTTESDMFFEVPENSKDPKIKIHEDFRLIATCNEDHLDLLSPALLNRFNIVYLDDQIQEQSRDERKNLIKFIFNDSIHKNAIHLTPPDIFDVLLNSLSDKCLTLSWVSRVCKSTARIIPYCQGVDSSSIAEFILNLLDCGDKFTIPPKIKKRLLEKFDGQQSENEEPFYYEKSESLNNLMALTMACSVTKTNICYIGSTGLGKTSMAVAFSEKTAISQKRGDVPYKLFPFHMESQVDDVFGSFSIDKGQPVISKGPLYQAMENGKVFVADEFNLAEDSTIQSLAVALEPSTGSKILIPGIGKSATISNKFMFIACQNDIRTAGRKILPPNISKRLRFFEYPSPDLNSLKSNCREISSSELIMDDHKITEIDADNIALFMWDLNNALLPSVATWSMRDIRKLFRRISDSQIDKLKYKNFSIAHHILFFVMSAVPSEQSEIVLEKLINILAKCFNISSSESTELSKCFKEDPHIIIDKGINYLMKNNVGVAIPDKINDLTNKPNPRLHSLWNAIFMVLVSNNKEPLLISGNSGFKTYLASLILPNAPILTLNQETSLSQLLGSVVLLNSKRSKYFYLEQFCKILKIREKNILDDLLSTLKKNY